MIALSEGGGAATQGAPPSDRHSLGCPAASVPAAIASP